LLETFQRLAVRNPKRTEAEIQADVRQFILSAPFELEPGDLVDVSLESQLGDRRRIDVEAGSTVIEVKRDLRREKAKKDAETQLAGYVQFRMQQTGTRYTGVLTDGTEWNCYDLVDGRLRLVAELTVDHTPDDALRLVVWLEGVLATTHNIAPTALNIEQRLGSVSSAYHIDRATLATLYKQNKKHPTIQVKRKLWAQLLLSALGTQFTDDDDLFIDHTLLVNTSEVIAHAVLGLPVQSLTPATLLTGDKFAEAGLHGVVEADFFDWVLEIEGGDTFIKTLAKRLMRFAWSDVNQDVLKILYENIIGTETRKRLGEYYTPDWLAEIVVAKVVPEPLKTRVLDPSCGSGTFLFHAVRNYIAAAEAFGHTVSDTLTNLTRHVVGMDLHPVAVTLARVTYILAIGRSRLLDPNRGSIQIPVYLGDSMQWREQGGDLWSAGKLVIHTEDKKHNPLEFPDAILDDAAKFDQLVNELADLASRRKPKSPLPSLKAVFARLAIPPEHHGIIEDTFKTMCQLHDLGRDHIWGYYVRNLARPLWLSKEGNRVDVIVGNPPWLAYSFMPEDMQAVFRSMSEDRELWADAKFSPHQDLSALFVVRACELYLRKGGKFGMVMPNAALDREHYAGFRTGTYSHGVGEMRIEFSEPWDLRRIRPHFFPRASCVAFGKRPRAPKAEDTLAMPHHGEIWSGKLEWVNAPWSIASGWLKRIDGKIQQQEGEFGSPYAQTFTQGATILPLLLFFVIEQESSPLGLPKGRVAVQSRRTTLEKKPWKNLPDISGVVERKFIRLVFSGEAVYPFRIGGSMLAVLPCNDKTLLSQDEIDLNPGLQQWWAQASEMWEKHRSSERLSLKEQIDFQSKLTKQLPTPPLRVVYNKSGMHICAAKLTNPKAVVTHGLYWAPVASEEEADYLCAVLNAPVTTELTRPLMSYGKDERDIHRHVWELPIPAFDADNPIHCRLSDLGAEAEKIVAEQQIDESVHFAAVRRHVRDALMETHQGQEIDSLVTDLISV
jgi:SAM-dependent methyltransferase